MWELLLHVIFAMSALLAKYLTIMGCVRQTTVRSGELQFGGKSKADFLSNLSLIILEDWRNVANNPAWTFATDRVRSLRTLARFSGYRHTMKTWSTLAYRSLPVTLLLPHGCSGLEVPRSWFALRYRDTRMESRNNAKHVIIYISSRCLALLHLRRYQRRVMKWRRMLIGVGIALPT